MSPQSEKVLNCKDQLLLASPLLSGSTFANTVIYITEHSPGGAVGFILNQQTGQILRDLETETDLSSLNTLEVSYGGPVLTDRVGFGCVRKVEDRIEFSGALSAPMAAELHLDSNSRLLALVGHSGWGPLQLDKEIRQGSWIIASPSVTLLDEVSGKKAWQHELRQISSYYELVSLTPDSPVLN